MPISRNLALAVPSPDGCAPAARAFLDHVLVLGPAARTSGP
ncbi:MULTISPECIES: hypothetical protein [unclassified Streptomyces]|nr:MULTISPECIES: hypothetical protein [unclassified Streptomyces]